MTPENTFEASFGHEIHQSSHPSMNIQNLCQPLGHDLHLQEQLSKRIVVNEIEKSPKAQTYYKQLNEAQKFKSHYDGGVWQTKGLNTRHSDRPLIFPVHSAEESSSFNSAQAFMSLPTASEMDSIERRIRSQERNRVAAMKSRQRKKKEWERLVEAEKRLATENDVLRKEINRLRRQLVTLQGHICEEEH